MEENESLNSTHDISLAKKILLYLNVTAFRISKATPTASDYRVNYRSREFSACLIAVCVAATAKLFFHPPFEFTLYLFCFALLFHTSIDLLFIKDIIIMAGNYNAYYNKMLYYGFFVFVVIGVFEGLTVLNNEIGHIPK